jgi:hypothetical protein
MSAVIDYLDDLRHPAGSPGANGPRERIARRRTTGIEAHEQVLPRADAGRR